MPTQVQIRGTTQATQEARTLASRELDVNTTDMRLSVHNGSTAGGIPHVNCFDAQNQEFTYATATGTDSIAITLAKAPASYQTGQAFEWKAANNNTGSATLNVNTLGAKTIYKAVGGALVVLEADDIVQGGIYRVAYDGTNMVLVGGVGGGGSETFISPVTISGTTDISTAIPSDVTRIDLRFEGIVRASTGTNSAFGIQVGSGSYSSSGYQSVVRHTVTGGATTAETETVLFLICETENTNFEPIYGHATIWRADVSSNTWIFTFQGIGLNNTDITASGYITLGGALDRVRFEYTNGTNQPNGGTVVLSYQ